MPSYPQYPYDPKNLLTNKLDTGVRDIIEYIWLLRADHWPSLWIGRGWSPGAEHGTGRAVDLIISTKVGREPTSQQRRDGQALAEYLWAHRSELKVHGVIWNGRLIGYSFPWRGWRKLSPRSNHVSSQHRDHVHVIFKRGAKLSAATPKPSGKPATPEPANSTPVNDGRSYTVVTQRYPLRVRADRSIGSRIVGHLRRGAHFTGKPVGDWVQITAGRYKGRYVYGKYVKTPETLRYRVTARSGLRVRTGPGLQYRRVGVLRSGAYFQGQAAGNWVRLLHAPYKGMYVSARYAKSR